MIASTPDVMLQNYLHALETRDLEQCMSFYTPESTVYFGSGTYQGTDAIRDWHTDRFQANLQITRLDRVVAEGNRIVIEMVITSNRLKAWRINTMRGKGVFTVDHDAFREVHFSVMGVNPFEGWQ